MPRRYERSSSTPCRHAACAYGITCTSSYPNSMSSPCTCTRSAVPSGGSKAAAFVEEGAARSQSSRWPSRRRSIDHVAAGALANQADRQLAESHGMVRDGEKQQQTVP